MAGAEAGSIGEVAVFCGSRLGHDRQHVVDARRLGAGLAARGIGLIYGGGRIGLMGALADAVLDNGGRVAGVIPDFLSAREVRHDRVTDLLVTDSMHTRKQAMFGRADAFITLPGGLGTLDETIEIITWRQLGLHDKPILLADLGGTAGPLIAAVQAAIEAGFADPSARDLFDVASDVEGVLAWLERVRGGTATPARNVERL